MHTFNFISRSSDFKVATMETIFALILGLIVLSATTSGAKLPSTFKKCNLEDDNFKECVKTSFQDALSQLNRPITEVGLISLEPLEIPALNIRAGKGAVQFDQKYTDIKLYGYSKAKVEDFAIDFDKKTIRMVLDEFLCQMKPKYEFDGKILVLPIQGKGDAIVTLENLRAVLEFKWEEYTKKGQTYLKGVDPHMTLDPEKMHFQFDNLFNGNKLLGDNINKVMNDNWQEVWADVKPSYEEAFGKIFLSVANGFFAKVPKSEIFEGV